MNNEETVLSNDEQVGVEATAPGEVTPEAPKSEEIAEETQVAPAEPVSIASDEGNDTGASETANGVDASPTEAVTE